MLYLKLHSGLLSYCKSLKRQKWQMIQCPYTQKSCQSRGSCPSFPSLRECWSPFAVRPTRGSVQPVVSLPSRAATSCPATNLTPRRQAKNALYYPVLVGNRLRLHTIPAFISIVGGILL